MSEVQFFYDLQGVSKKSVILDFSNIVHTVRIDCKGNHREIYSWIEKIISVGPHPIGTGETYSLSLKQSILEIKSIK